MDDAAKAEHQECIQELWHFINSQLRRITQFDETLVRKLMEGVTIDKHFLEFQFKSGVAITVEK